MNRTIGTVAALIVTVLSAGCADTSAPGSGAEKDGAAVSVETPELRPAPDLEGLLARVRVAVGNAGAKVAVREVADEYRPESGVAEFLSEDGRVHLIIGANGNADDPDGQSLKITPRGIECTIAIAGDGATGATGDGGNGGDVLLLDDTRAEVILLAGRGGAGAKRSTGAGGNGGDGGGAYGDGHALGGGMIVGGAGGKGGVGRPGGAGGRGGSSVG